MIKQQFSGKTLDDALTEAAKTLNTDKNSLSYNILSSSPGTSLFSKLFSRGIKLEAWVESKTDLQAAAREAVFQALNEQPERSNESSRKDKREKRPARPVQTFKPTPPLVGTEKNRVPKPRSPGQSAPPIAPEKPRVRDLVNERPSFTFESPGVFDLFLDYTERFLKGFEIEPSSYEVKKVEVGEIHVLVESEHLEDLLSRSERLAGAFEHVFKRIAQKKIGDVSGRIFLDAGTAQEQRKKRLHEMAVGMAEKVKSTGKTITLTSKSSQERRIIHMSLDGYVGVATRSVGVGDHRKLVIFSTDKSAQKKSKVEDGNSLPQADTRIVAPAHAEAEVPRKTRRRRGARNKNQGVLTAQNAESESNLPPKELES